MDAWEGVHKQTETLVTHTKCARVGRATWESVRRLRISLMTLRKCTRVGGRSWESVRTQSDLKSTRLNCSHEVISYAVSGYTKRKLHISLLECVRASIEDSVIDYSL